jgi:uncharacterized protein
MRHHSALEVRRASPASHRVQPGVHHGLLALVVFVVAGVPALAQQGPPRDPGPAIVTGGEGVVRVAPDVAHVGLATESRARSPHEAQQQNARAMAEVQARLRKAGIPEQAIQTVGFELQPQFDYVDGRQVLRGYVARNRIDVRVQPVDRVGEIIDLAVGGGAAMVSGLRFDTSRREELEREAIKRAVGDARARAEAAAAGAGATLDRIIRIEERRAEPGRPMPMMAMRADAEAAQTPVAPGEIEIRAQVTLTVALR